MKKITLTHSTVQSENKHSTLWAHNTMNPVDRMTDSCQQGGHQGDAVGDSVVTVPCQAEPGHDSTSSASRF